MNCDQFINHLDNYLDGTADDAALAGFAQHAGDCPACATAVANGRKLRDRLARYGELTRPEPAAGFYELAIERASAQSDLRRQRMRWSLSGFGGAIAAGLMIWFVSGLFFTGPNVAETPVPSVTMALETPQTFNLVFSSATALAGASMTVTLPDGIEVDGFADQREIKWQTSLSKGRNILPLTLIATSPIGGELLARLQHEDDNKLFRLQVLVI